jgi:hypothetical protein
VDLLRGIGEKMMILAQQTTTPDTSGYMVLGYAVLFVVLTIYLISLVIRNRNLNQDADMLEELEKKEQQQKSENRSSN